MSRYNIATGKPKFNPIFKEPHNSRSCSNCGWGIALERWEALRNRKVPMKCSEYYLNRIKSICKGCDEEPMFNKWTDKHRTIT